MKELIMSGATTAVVAIVAAIAVVLYKKGCAYMNQLLEQGKAKAEKEGKQYLVDLFEAAGTVLNALTTTTVSKIEATKAAALREAVHAGNEAAEKLYLLSDEAYKEIAAQLPPAIEAALEGSVNDLEKYIRDKIEEVLPEVKQKYRGLTSKETGNEAGT